MKLSDFHFFLSEALIGMKRSSLMIFISVATITVSLIVFGIFLLMTFNLNNLVNFVVSKLEIRVYLRQDITKAEITNLQNTIRSWNNIKSVKFIDKNTAWDNFSKQFSNLQLKKVLDSNPLPNSINIKLKDNKNIQEIINKLKPFNSIIQDISYGKVLAERIALFSTITKISGSVLVVLLTLATLLIIVNTIRLTVIARQDEITIMQLVGATNPFIEWPFLIEGLVIGGVGAFFSILFIKYSYLFFASKFQEYIPYFPLVLDTKILWTLYSIIFITGTILGIFGAYLSVSRSLKKVN